MLDPAGLDLEASRGASVLNSHNQHGLGNVLGTLDAVWREGDAIVGRIRFSERDDVAPYVADVRAGVIQHLSVGYEVAQRRDGADAAGNRTRTAVKWTMLRRRRSSRCRPTGRRAPALSLQIMQ